MRTWSYRYSAAAELVRHAEPVDVGDELGLRWRGQLQRPELAAAGTGRRAIVTAVLHDPAGIAREVIISLIADGNDAQP